MTSNLKYHIYSIKYNFHNVGKYAKKFGKITLSVPEGYLVTREKIPTLGEYNVYYYKYHSGEYKKWFIIKFDNREAAVERIICPHPLSQYMCYHDKKIPAEYEIEYKNDKFIVTKKTGEKTC